MSKNSFGIGGTFNLSSIISNKLKSVVLPVAFVIIAVVFGFVSLKVLVPQKDKLVGCNDIAGIVVNNDTLQLSRGSLTRLPAFFFEFDQQGILSLNDSTYWGRCSRHRDSLFINLKKQFHNINTVTGTIDTGFTLIKGNTDHNDRIQIMIKRMPDAELAYY